jgi:hypothetical protein
MLREGTEVKLRFTEPISSKTAALDDPVTLEVVDDVRVDNVIVIRSGARTLLQLVRRSRRTWRMTSLSDRNDKRLAMIKYILL